jgi:hypothetical protein
MMPMTWVAAWYSLTIYIPDSPVLLFFMAFIGLFVAFKLAVWLIKAIPFL